MTTTEEEATVTAAAGRMLTWCKPSVNAFNELLACYLCRGYMIDPTAIDICRHTYCRSCILKYLHSETSCPQCKFQTSKSVTTYNLKSDNVLRSIIYKLVPGLYQAERRRLMQFNCNHKRTIKATTQTLANEKNDSIGSRVTGSLAAALDNDDEEFLSPEEPISLSIEYHPVLAKQCLPDDRNSKQIPPTCYLQCPANFKIHSLKRFLHNKFDIDSYKQCIAIDIMYEDEILPNYLTLMDVAYCYQWPRKSPMQFTYRFVIDQQPTEEYLHKSRQSTFLIPKARRAESTKQLDNQESHFPEVPHASTDLLQTDKTQQTADLLAITTLANEKQKQETNHKKIKIKKLTTKKSSSSAAAAAAAAASSPVLAIKQNLTTKLINKKITSSKRLPKEKFNLLLPTLMNSDCKSLRSNNLRFSEISGAAARSVNKTDSSQCNNNDNISKSSSNNSANSKDNSITTTTTTTRTTSLESLSSKSWHQIPVNVSSSINNFKSTASPTYTTNNINMSIANNMNTTITTTTTTTNNNNNNSSKTNTNKSKYNVVVSIPHSQLVNSSAYDFEDDSDNQTLSQLKNLTCKAYKTNNRMADNTIGGQLTGDFGASDSKSKTPNLPKLKIELNSLKSQLIESPTTFASQSKPSLAESGDSKSSLLDESKSIADEIDLETYIKNIGLKPIEFHSVERNTSTTMAQDSSSHPFHKNKNLNNKIQLPSAACETTNSFSNLEFNSFSISHKKHKKKHSKESKKMNSHSSSSSSSSGGSSNKHRKRMHAEISSNSAEKSLKMKVKITPSIIIKSIKNDKKKLQVSYAKQNRQMQSQNTRKPTSSKSTKISEAEAVQMSPVASSTGTTYTVANTTQADSMLINSSKKSEMLQQLPAKSLSSETSSITTKLDNDKWLNKLSALSSKSLNNNRETNLTLSPPLPPSLFKTTSLTFSTYSPTAMSFSKYNTTATTAGVTLKSLSTSDAKEKPNNNYSNPPLSQNKISLPSNTVYFAVPNTPRTKSNYSAKYLATPGSIACEASKQFSNALKRYSILDTKQNSSVNDDRDNCAKKIKLDKSNNAGNKKNSLLKMTNNMTSAGLNITGPSSSSSSAYAAKISNQSIDIPPLYTPFASAFNKKNSPIATTNNKNSLMGNTNRNSPNSLTTNPTRLSQIACSVATPTTTLITSVMGPPPPIEKIITKKSPLTGLNIVPTAVKSPPLSSVLPLATNRLPNTNTSITQIPTNQKLLSSAPALISFLNDSCKASTSAVSLANTKQLEYPLPVTSSTGNLNFKSKCPTKEYRLPSRESSTDILDLSASNRSKNGGSKKPAVAAGSNTFGINLEMALNKIKQNMSLINKSDDNGGGGSTRNPVATTTTTTNFFNNTNNTTVTTVKTHTTADTMCNIMPVSKTLTLMSSQHNQDDLLNLHMLSESATAREKLSIPPYMAPSVYEKSKVNQNFIVHQQNASVRSIPNPSALAFRNQQPLVIPFVEIPKSVLTSTASGNNNCYGLLDSNNFSKSKRISPPKLPLLPLTTTSSTNLTTTGSLTTNPLTLSSRSLTIKKHASIDEVAANLNLRAAAAEASAKALANHHQFHEEAQRIQPATSTSTFPFSNSQHLNNTNHKPSNNSPTEMKLNKAMEMFLKKEFNNTNLLPPTMVKTENNIKIKTEFTETNTQDNNNGSSNQNLTSESSATTTTAATPMSAVI